MHLPNKGKQSMQNGKKFSTIDMSLTVCFTALYALFSYLPLSQVLGLFGKYITAATISAPIIGMIFGVKIGVFSTFLGGIVALFFSPYFSPPSLVAGTITSLCAGLLCAGKRRLCIFIYVTLLLFFALYPSIGPLWLYPPMIWFQIVGLLILVSPLQSKATKNLASNDNSKFFFAFFITSLTPILSGQISGSIAFEFISWPTLISDANFYRAYWQGLTFLYPLERAIIALAATFVGTALSRTLKSSVRASILNRANQQEKFP